MHQYWINKDGKQSGPHSMEELQEMDLSGKTYVWFTGLDDWKRIADVPELASLAAQPEEPAAEETAPVEEVTPVEEPAEESPVQEVAEEPATDEVTPETDAATDETDAPAAPENAEQDVVTPQPPEYFAPVQNAPQYAPQYVPQYAPQPAMAQETAPECPPTNLVWAILCTIFCCTPFGIAAIVFAAMVKNNYNQGNYKKAQKYSDWAAWLCILAIVLNIIILPFTFLLSAI